MNKSCIANQLRTQALSILMLMSLSTALFASVEKTNAPQIDTCATFSGVALNKTYGNPIQGVEVKLLNKCTGDTESVMSQADGSFSICLPCNCDFDLSAQKSSFVTSNGKITTVGIDCTGNLQAQLLMTPEKTELPAKPAAPMAARETIIIDKLYYDYAKFTLRPEARQELDKIASKLIQYPSMKIELASHTDVRGSAQYNQQLSKSRSQAAADYITSKGVTASQIRVVGFGERYPRNRCTTGVKCSEAEHEYNRRTEIRVLEFDSNIEIKYIDSRSQ